MRIAISEDIFDAEISGVVHSLCFLLASGVGCAGALSDRVVVVTALQDCRDCSRIGTRCGLGAGDFACKDTPECMISISP
jgi:hypothetical protein